MRYKIVLQKSEEGYSVSCPGLPGCWSQGATEAEALEPIAHSVPYAHLIPDREPQVINSRSASQGATHRTPPPPSAYLYLDFISVVED